MPPGAGEEKGTGDRLIQSAASAKVSKATSEEVTLMKLKDSVRKDYGSFPYCGDGNPGMDK
eukprot:gene47198-52916_t